MSETPISQEKIVEQEEKILNRWLVVAGAMMIQLALGAIYAWSAFTRPLQGTTDIASQYAFTKTQTQAIFSAGLAFFALFTIVGGRLQQKYGPRIIAFIGGLVLGIGYILGGMTGASFPAKLITIGVIGGTGIGLAYVVPIAVGVKWFPDKKGLVTGLAVAGFGFGAFIWILLANPPSVLPLTGLIQSGNEYTISNVDGVFRLYGILFMALVVLGSIVMVNPPEGWKPKGWNPEAVAKKGSVLEGCQLMPGQMLKKKQFYLLWSMFFVGALAGLMVIGNVQNFATDAGDNVPDWYEVDVLGTDPYSIDATEEQQHLYEMDLKQWKEGNISAWWNSTDRGNLTATIPNVNEDAAQPTDDNWKDVQASDGGGFMSRSFSAEAAGDYGIIGAAVCLPIFNGTGRIAWGKLSDRMGRKNTIILMSASQGAMMLAFFYTTFNPIAFYAVAAMIGFNFGGNFALFPAATADTFGSKYVGLNYGFVFTSYGIGGIAGPILAGIVQDANMSFIYAFIPAAVLCFIACLLALLYNPTICEPVAKSPGEEGKPVDTETGELKKPEATYYPPVKNVPGEDDTPPVETKEQG